MQTLNIGLGQSLRYFSSFGVLAAAPTSYSSSKIFELLKKETEEKALSIDLLYALCGTEDFVAGESHRAAIDGLSQPNEYLTPKNFFSQYVKGGHDAYVAALGIYNFLKARFAR